MNLDRIPQGLKDNALFNVWKYEERNGKRTKPPYNPKTWAYGDSSDPSTFSTFHDAATAYNSTTGQFDGMGVGIFGDLAAVDIDNCLMPDGKLTEMAKDIIVTMGTYTEWSPSRKGIRIFFYAPGFQHDTARYYINNQKKGLEVYIAGCTKKYVTVTGDALFDSIPVHERSEQITAVLEKYMRRPGPKQTKKPTGRKTLSALTADEVIAKAHAAKNGPAFAALWNGDAAGYNSHSEADLGLCNLLAFWTGCNADMMDELFRVSGLYREKKWNRKQTGSTYGALTIQKAIAECRDTYNPDYKVTSTNPSGAKKQVAPGASVRPTDFTDTANSRIFAREYLNKAIYTTATGWLIWNGKKWEENDLEAAGLAMFLTDQMLSEARAEMKAAGDAMTAAKVAEDDEAKREAKVMEDRAKAYMSHAKASRAKTKISAMLALAQTHLQVKPELLDADPYALNTPAGIIDLRTGVITSHDPSKLCTKITRYGPGVKGAARWTEHLDMVSCSDEKLINFLQQISGMAAIGSVFEENLIIGIGDGKNGKSAHFNSQAAVLGDYAGTLSADVLTTANRSKGAELAALKGKRLVIAAETDEGARLSTSMLKQLTSTDKIHAERKYRDPEDFTPSHTAVLYTNHFPRVGSTDTGTWRRIVPVPFDAKIPPEKEVKNYAEVLAREAGEAIMTWIVDGAVNFYSLGHRLVRPEVVEILIEEYQNRNDWMGEFLDEFCEVGQGRSVKAGALYSTYHEWARDAHGYARKSDAFGIELEKRGFEKRKAKQGLVWYGLNLAPREAPFHYGLG